MRRHTLLSGVVIGFVSLLSIAADKPDQPNANKPAEKDWAMNATIIEACSCPMFCQCYFDTKPAAAPAPAANADPAANAGNATSAAHAGHGSGGDVYCRFNNAFRVNTGQYGDTKLDGAKFWVGGDLGSEFSDGEMDWAVLYFDPSVTPQQREGIQAALAKLYPVKWKSFTVGADMPIEWTAARDRSVARLDGGKGGEVVLTKNQGMTEEPIVIKNLKYWGAPRNDGFVLMQNEVEALRQTPPDQKTFEFKRTNGFMITFDISSKDVSKDASKGAPDGAMKN